MLADYLTKDVIRLQVPVKNWQEAVSTAGNLLVNNGNCLPKYVDAMIRAVNEFGPYMVLAPGIALAHARPEDGVVKMGMSIVTLEKPVNFGSPENDPVKLVIGFGGIDHDSHLKMLQELAIFLMDEGNQELLKSANEISGVLKAFGATER